MSWPRRRWILRLTGIALGLGVVAGPRLAAQTGQKPVFKSGIDVIAVDVAVVDKNGNPVAGLRPDQFDVTIDGKPRRVVSAEFVEFAARDKAAAATLAPATVARPLFSSNLQPGPAVSRGRLIYLAIDQGSFQPFGARGAMEAARRFIDRLQPEDRVGLVAFPQPDVFVPASRDRAPARDATAHIIGSAQPFRTSGIDKNLSLAEAIDIHGGDPYTFAKVMQRECVGRVGSDRQACEEEVRATAVTVGRNAEYQATRSLSGIEAVIHGLAQIRERKTLVLVSAGLPVADRSSNDLQLTSTVAALGREAAAANLNFYVLHVDSGFIDAFSASERTIISDSLFRDLGIMSSGLETIAGASGGTLARVTAGADFAFDKVLRETAAAYLLGVEPVETDRDSKAHRIVVKVKLPNIEVRSRREFVMPKAEAKPATADEVLVAAFRTERQESALPIRVTTNCLTTRAGGGYRVLLSADIGDGNAGPVEMRLLYAITNASSGKSMAPVGQRPTLRPRPGGPAGAVSYTAEHTLAAGSYTVRFAALDASGRAGSVDHAFTVGLTKGEGILLSDLILLEPRQKASDQIEVMTDGQLRGSAADAYVEITRTASSVQVTGVTIGVADQPDGPALVSMPAQISRGEGGGSWAAGVRLNLALLPPGDYFAVAVVLADKRVLGRVTRPIRIERAVARAAAATADAGVLPRVSFAAGETGSLVRAFVRQDVLDKGTVEYFLGRLRSASPEAAAAAPAAAAADALVEGKFDAALAALAPSDQKSLAASFLAGLALLGKGALEPAAAQFRASLDLAPDFLPAAFYLGACYAAGGRDLEAVGAWQTALITESDARIVYDVLGDALLRLQDGDEAAILLGEARGKWADDDRFVPRLAVSEALRSKPREAMALLDEYIARRPADTDALLLAVRLIYDEHAAGGQISPGAEDAAAARRYADLYKAAGGPSAALVERWVAFIGRK